MTHTPHSHLGGRVDRLRTQCGPTQSLLTYVSTIILLTLTYFYVCVARAPAAARPRANATAARRRPAAKNAAARRPRANANAARRPRANAKAAARPRANAARPRANAAARPRANAAARPRANNAAARRPAASN